MIYGISHRTTFRYTDSVSMSQHLVHLLPRAHPGQRVLRSALIVEPAPTVIRDDQDYFGNPTTYLTVEEPHDRLVAASTSTVDVAAVAPPPAESTAPWDTVFDGLSQATDAPSLSAYQFAFDSPYTGSSRAADYARPSFPAGRPVLAGAIDLMSRIFTDFTYEGGVTDVYTPVDKVFADKRGVCQDFAHLMLAALRGLDLPARYVSGYVMTHPPEGQEKLIGADASHAWVSVWVSDFGWVDLDPTNDLIPGDEHITVAWGRDYGDVSPINGMVLGGGKQTVDVSVDVRPVETGEAGPGTEPAVFPPA